MEDPLCRENVARAGVTGGGCAGGGGGPGGPGRVCEGRRVAARDKEKMTRRGVGNRRNEPGRPRREPGGGVCSRLAGPPTGARERAS